MDLWIHPVTFDVQKAYQVGYVRYIEYDQYEALKSACDKMSIALRAVKNTLNEGGSLAELIDRLEEALLVATSH